MYDAQASRSLPAPVLRHAAVFQPLGRPTVLCSLDVTSERIRLGMSQTHWTHVNQVHKTVKSWNTHFKSPRRVYISLVTINSDRTCKIIPGQPYRKPSSICASRFSLPRTEVEKHCKFFLSNDFFCTLHKPIFFCLHLS